MQRMQNVMFNIFIAPVNQISDQAINMCHY